MPSWKPSSRNGSRRQIDSAYFARNTHLGTNEYKKEVVIVLLTDEQYVVKWLSQYGALPRAQIIKMLQKPPQTAEKILRNLKRQMRIADVSGGYYIGLDPMCQPDQRMHCTEMGCPGITETVSSKPSK